MNLKEAFRMQNKLDALFDEAQNILDDESCVTLTKRTYLYKKSNPEAQNETVTVIPDTDYYRQINQLIDFAVYLIEQREKLSAAISKTKRGLPVDLDSEVSLNTYRQRLSQTFRNMAKIKGREVTDTNAGIGYRFNNEGNQISYKCDVERVTTINFDRNTVRKYAAKLSERSDSISEELDKCMINYEVDFVPDFDVNDTFDEVFESFTTR